MVVVLVGGLAGWVVTCQLQLGGGGRDESPVRDLEELAARRDDQGHVPNHVPVLDASGSFTTASAHGSIDFGNEFFRELGANGRRCVSCHVPTVGWTVTPAQLQATFERTQGGAYPDELGLGAVFRPIDGAISPTADVSTLERRREAYRLLLARGLIRIHLPMPANAEFELVAVDDPYHYASAAELSLFRRPLPTTNLKFVSTVMWDGRFAGESVIAALETQASDATVVHAQGAPLSPAVRASIVNFLGALATAQTVDRGGAGRLDRGGVKGGPDAVLAQPFYIGINDNFGDSRTGAPFSPIVFTLFDAWAQQGAPADVDEARAAVARGQALFNTKPIAITGVSGINDEPAFGKPAKLVGTCTTCHNTPNGGNHSVVAPLNIGLVGEWQRTSDLPLYTLRNKATRELVKVTDPGRAMIDGKWSHIGRFKGPMLRDLAPRAPYFHNGSAADLAAVVGFYDKRFSIQFTEREKADLVAFLRSL